MKDSDNVEIVAVCDVYDKRREAAAKLTGGKPYKDYRALLDNKDIDYVLIATPEHWHFQMTMDALDAGKHIYCEKPMTKTVEQSKKVVARVKQAGLKMQVGVQGMSDDSYETAHEYIKDGVLGNVVIAQIDYSRNYSDDFWTNPTRPRCAARRESRLEGVARPGAQAALGSRPFPPLAPLLGLFGRHRDRSFHPSRHAHHQGARPDVPRARGGHRRQVRVPHERRPRFPTRSTSCSTIPAGRRSF